MEQPLKSQGSNVGLKTRTSMKEPGPNENPSNDRVDEDVNEKFNLAFIQLEGIEDIRYYKEKKSDNDPSEFIIDTNYLENIIDTNYLEKSENDYNDYFIRGIIYGSQVVLRKLFNGNEEKKIKVIKNLMNIEELEDDVSVSFIHGISYKQSSEKKIDGDVFLVREWIKGKSLWDFKKSKHNVVKADLLNILYSLARIIEHYHQYSLSYLFLRPKKVIIGSDFTVVLNDIIKINSYVFNEKIKKQLSSKEEFRNQNRFLHPFLFKLEKLEINMFYIYQIFDLYSFGCLCYYFYFNKLPWDNAKDKDKDKKNCVSYDSIYTSYYGRDVEEKDDYNTFYSKLKWEERLEVIKKDFFNNEEISLHDNECKVDSYDEKLMKIILNCIWPKYEFENDRISYKYTMRNALEDLSEIKCVEEFKKNKTFNYNFQEGKN
jgi:hypothetical protein